MIGTFDRNRDGIIRLYMPTIRAEGGLVPPGCRIQFCEIIIDYHPLFRATYIGPICSFNSNLYAKNTKGFEPTHLYEAL